MDSGTRTIGIRNPRGDNRGALSWLAPLISQYIPSRFQFIFVLFQFIFSLFPVQFQYLPSRQAIHNPNMISYGTILDTDTDHRLPGPRTSGN